MLLSQRRNHHLPLDRPLEDTSDVLLFHEDDISRLRQRLTSVTLGLLVLVDPESHILLLISVLVENVAETKFKIHAD